jgi:hypothetical protein
MADFVKGLFGGQKPVQAPVVGDDGTYTVLHTRSRVQRPGDAGPHTRPLALCSNLPTRDEGAKSS